MMEGTGTLEEQLAAIAVKAHEVRLPLSCFFSRFFY